MKADIDAGESSAVLVLVLTDEAISASSPTSYAAELSQPLEEPGCRWQVFRRADGPLRGLVHVPGDKSLSHRAVLFSAMASGTTRVAGVLDSADVRATISAVRALGAHVELAKQADGSLAGSVRGWGDACPAAWTSTIDCGNSGTTARLLMGVLAGCPIEITLTGTRRCAADAGSPVRSPAWRASSAENTFNHRPRQRGLSVG
jgi:hypothetical protein